MWRWWRREKVPKSKSPKVKGSRGPSIPRSKGPTYLRVTFKYELDSKNLVDFLGFIFQRSIHGNFPVCLSEKFSYFVNSTTQQNMQSKIPRCKKYFQIFVFDCKITGSQDRNRTELNMTSITELVYNQFSKSFCLMVTLSQNIKV